MSLLNNPLGELLGPVNRLETSVEELGKRMSAVEALPRIEEELAETRAATLELLEAVNEIGAEFSKLAGLLDRALTQDGRAGK